ncbi:MAG: hypothetical protein A3J74_03430 [Elusimicrobia bacterium RIFCSPHIGHO2_02_FULL_57_9]|nr:MAG: hypothetical protein A3J74_03430 [Elusimicrobia bacterium RIFCSPHIGHO2_02_FULL_57_9]
MSGKMRWAGLIAAAGVIWACTPPKYVAYVSRQNDFKCSAPWGWSVMSEKEGTRYANTTFIGPFAPEFYLGAPSLSVRWHAYSYPHRLADGVLEMYSSADDYIRQMINNVYGPQAELLEPVHDIFVAKRKAKHFVVLAPAPAPEGRQWGTVLDAQSNKPVNLRQHAYVIVPMQQGFYVLVYPATREGFKLYEPHFNQLVNTFLPLLK